MNELLNVNSWALYSKKMNWNRWHDQPGTLIPDRPNVSLSRDLSLFPMASPFNFSCVVWSLNPVDVNFHFKPCDLRKPGDCNVERNFRYAKKPTRHSVSIWLAITHRASLVSVHWWWNGINFSFPLTQSAYTNLKIIIFYNFITEVWYNFLILKCCC